MNVGFLATISDNTPQNCYLSMFRGMGDIGAGVPMSMAMISKYVDYNCSQDAAKLVTDKGTLTNRMMTDAKAYSAIQSIVSGWLGKFESAKLISNVKLSFPEFTVAKVSRSALSAASSWSGMYADDLDEVTCSGGLSLE
jgi:hypothetical protein